MRFLADESCDARIVRGLLRHGHDILAIADRECGASDERVIEIAVAEHRILLTEDKDFGQLVFAAGSRNSGVILVRAPARARSGVVDAIAALAADRGDALYGCFAVVEAGRTRITTSP